MAADNPYKAPQAVAKVEDSAVPVGSWFLRVAGAILAAFGLLGAWLLSLGVRRMLGGSLPDPSLSFGFGILTLITAFCLYVGVKLLFDFRHVRGSLMGPVAWYSVGACIGGVCALVAVASLLGDSEPTAWATALFTLVCGGSSLLAAVRRR